MTDASTLNFGIYSWVCKNEPVTPIASLTSVFFKLLAFQIPFRKFTNNFLCPLSTSPGTQHAKTWLEFNEARAMH